MTKIRRCPVRKQELVLICRYSEDEINIEQIIQSLFEAFLRKELKNTVKGLKI